MTKFIDVCSKPESDIQRYSPTLIDTIAFVTGVLLPDRRKFGRVGLSGRKRRDRLGEVGACDADCDADCGADCCARGNGGGSCGGGKLTKLCGQS